MFKWLTALSLMSFLLIQGCAPVIVGGGAAGVSVVHDRRSTGTFVEDQEIELKFFNFKQNNSTLTKYSDISCNSYNRRVLLTGAAASRSIADRAVNYIRSLKGVRHVINEIEIHAQYEGGIKGTINDAYIQTQVKVKLFNIKIQDFDPTRVNVTVYNGSVYLMGLVTHQEADAAAEQARFVKGVKRVVKYFEYVNAAPPPASTANNASQSGVTTYPAQQSGGTTGHDFLQ